MVYREMVNGEVWRDTAGNEIWSNGGHMIREDGVFHWVGAAIGPGQRWTVVLYSSRDLREWEYRAEVLPRDGEFGRFAWMGRPGLLRNRTTGKYVIVFEADGRRAGLEKGAPREWFRHKVGYAESGRLAGPYRLAGLDYPEPGRSTGDQSVFQEGDDAYLVTVLDAEGLARPINVSLAIYRLAGDYLAAAEKVFEGFDTRKGASPGLEAPHVVRAGEAYYWFASGLKGWASTPTRYATARSLSGPWSEMRVLPTDPPSEDSFNTQHDFVIPAGEAEYLYAGDRYSQFHGAGTGRNIFLPLEFSSGGPKLVWRDRW